MTDAMVRTVCNTSLPGHGPPEPTRCDENIDPPWGTHGDRLAFLKQDRACGSRFGDGRSRGRMIESRGDAAEIRPSRSAGYPRVRAPQFWLLEPAASIADSRWQDRPIWRWVVVAAPSAAFARQIAENWALPRVVPQIGNESGSPRAGFLDEKLYHVRPVRPAPGWWCSPRRDAEQVIDAALLREAPRRIEI